MNKITRKNPNKMFWIKQCYIKEGAFPWKRFEKIVNTQRKRRKRNKYYFNKRRIIEI